MNSRFSAKSGNLAFDLCHIDLHFLACHTGLKFQYLDAGVKFYSHIIGPLTFALIMTSFEAFTKNIFGNRKKKIRKPAFSPFLTMSPIL